jgi:hypothetical protein
LEKINDKNKIDLYLDRADELSKIISEYEISSVDVIDATVDEAVDIFGELIKREFKYQKTGLLMH